MLQLKRSRKKLQNISWYITPHLRKIYNFTLKLRRNWRSAPKLLLQNQLYFHDAVLCFGETLHDDVRHLDSEEKTHPHKNSRWK